MFVDYRRILPNVRQNVFCVEVARDSCKSQRSSDMQLTNLLFIVSLVLLSTVVPWTQSACIHDLIQSKNVVSTTLKYEESTHKNHVEKRDIEHRGSGRGGGPPRGPPPLRLPPLGPYFDNFMKIRIEVHYSNIDAALDLNQQARLKEVVEDAVSNVRHLFSGKILSCFLREETKKECVFRLCTSSGEHNAVQKLNCRKFFVRVSSAFTCTRVWHRGILMEIFKSTTDRRLLPTSSFEEKGQTSVQENNNTVGTSDNLFFFFLQNDAKRYDKADRFARCFAVCSNENV